MDFMSLSWLLNLVLSAGVRHQVGVIHANQQMNWSSTLSQAAWLRQVPQSREVLVHILRRLATGKRCDVLDFPGRHDHEVTISGHKGSCTGTFCQDSHTSKAFDRLLDLL